MEAISEGSDRHYFGGSSNFWVPLFTDYGYEKPRNEKVIGVLIGEYTTEVYYNKPRRTSYTNYVTYRVPEGEVSFRRAPGELYPERAILYRK